MKCLKVSSKRGGTVIAAVLSLTIAAACLLHLIREDNDLQMLSDVVTRNNSRVYNHLENSVDRFFARAESALSESYELTGKDLETRKNISRPTLNSAASSKEAAAQSSSNADGRQQDSHDTSSESQLQLQAKIVEDELHNLLNGLREEKGVSTLVRAASLNQAALIRAEEATVSFSHTRTNGSEFYTVLHDIAYGSYSSCGENLAYRTYCGERSESELKEIAAKLFMQWVNSEGHYNNMINAKFNEVGVAVKIEGDKFTAAQVFVDTFF